MPVRARTACVGALLGLGVSARPAPAQEVLLCTVKVPLAAEPERPASDLGQLCRRLSACWRPPESLAGRDGVEITVRFLIDDRGTVAGLRHTYAAGVPDRNDRASLVSTTFDAIRRCVPVEMTYAVAGRMAGRMIALRLIYTRPTP